MNWADTEILLSYFYSIDEHVPTCTIYFYCIDGTKKSLVNNSEVVLMSFSL